MSEIYQKLQHYFDSMASGYPKTKDGIEIKVLQMMYSEDEAALYLNMTSKKETAREASNRLGSDENKISDKLEAMSKKGLIWRERKDGKTYYSTSPFVVGILEYNVKRLAEDPDFARNIAVYGMQGLMKSLASAGEQHMRTIPVNRQLVSKWPVATYDDAVNIINSHQKLAVGLCSCRTIFNTIGMKKCNNPIEVCIGFDKMAEYYIENNSAREISKDEAVSIITKSDEHGMVLQPFNGKDAGALCSCCGDCCTILLSLKMRPAPAKDVRSSYFAEITSDACSGCELCVDRCQINAIRMNEDNIAVIDLNRCIGCGLCVTTCPSGAAYLVKKPESELIEPPGNLEEVHEIMAMKRGLKKGG
jgi:ferredoxin